MARHINSMADLKEYLRSLHANSGHHAKSMMDVFPKVLSAVIERMDEGSLYAWEQNGQIKNSAWATFQGNKYFFSYDHINDCVSVKLDSTQGHVIDSFHQADSFDDISRRIHGLQYRSNFITSSSSP